MFGSVPIGEGLIRNNVRRRRTARAFARGKWSQLRGKLKEKWGKLTDDDVNQLAGHRDYLIGRLQERYGIAKDDADRQITEFERSLH